MAHTKQNVRFSM